MADNNAENSAELLTVGEAAERAGVHANTVRRYLKSEGAPFFLRDMTNGNVRPATCARRSTAPKKNSAAPNKNSPPPKNNSRRCAANATGCDCTCETSPRSCPPPKKKPKARGRIWNWLAKPSSVSASAPRKSVARPTN
jgi:hypothetical protein